VLLVLLGVFAPALARAQGPAIEPPRVVAEETPRYPEGETGEARVLVELVVEADGTVSSIRVIQGDEPFAAAAVEAARRTRFHPARSAGVAVRARIRVEMRFSPPAAEAPLTSPTGEGDAGEPLPLEPPEPAARPKVAPVEEVRVLGRRADPRTPTEHRLGRGEMRVIPGAFGDPFRAIDILPGIVPIVSGLPYFYIRGAPPSAVGYYVDEVRVPYLFHFGLGPGVVHPAIVEEVALHPAAFPARYGRFAGGIVAGTTREPAKELYGEGQIRLFDAGAYVEAPLAGGRGSAGIGGRYSYTAALLSLLAPDVSIDYRDYNARASYQLSDRWRVSALAIGANDFASDTEDGVERIFFASEFHRLDVRLDHRGEDGSTSRVAATLGIDRTRLEDARFAQNVLVGARGRHVRSITRDVDVELGADVLVESFAGDLPSPYAVPRESYEQATTLFAPRTETASGAWVSSSYRPAKGWDLTGTLRGDVFTSAGRNAFGPSPRVSMRVPLTERAAFLGALGVSPQPPAFAIPVPAIGYRGLPGGLAFAYQKSAGVELLLPLRFTLKTVGFHHSYFNLRDFAQDRGDLDFERPQLDPSSPSQAYGLEIFLMRKLTERFSAFASATLSRAQLGGSRRAAPRVSPFDRTYVAQIGGVVDLGRRWRASSRFLTYRGWPASQADEDDLTSGRLPPFYRVDARLEKRWALSERRSLALVFEGLNVTGSKEILSRSCVRGAGCRNNEFGPLIVPSIGLEGTL
jgi:TonB family protein